MKTSQTLVRPDGSTPHHTKLPVGIVDDAGLATVWIDRDLSWLDFNDRVLAEAVDERTPLLERAKFLAIFTSNLDEFFMKRIAVLRERSTPPRLAAAATSENGSTRCSASRPSAFGNGSSRIWRSMAST